MIGFPTVAIALCVLTMHHLNVFGHWYIQTNNTLIFFTYNSTFFVPLWFLHSTYHVLVSCYNCDWSRICLDYMVVLTMLRMLVCWWWRSWKGKSAINIFPAGVRGSNTDAQNFEVNLGLSENFPRIRIETLIYFLRMYFFVQPSRHFDYFYFFLQSNHNAGTAAVTKVKFQSLEKSQ